MPAYPPPTPDAPFARSRKQFESIITLLADPPTAQHTHAALEDQLTILGRDLLRALLQDHLDLRAVREPRHQTVTAADGTHRHTAERGHQRGLTTVFGQVEVTRLAYRTRAAANLYPADGVLNLPAERHSHGLRRLAALEGVGGSYAEAAAAIGRTTGCGLGNRQLQQLVAQAATDFEDFSATRGTPPASSQGEVLVISVDGKGIVMRPDALRAATRQAAATRKLTCRLSPAQRPHRKRMAEVGCVYDATPVARAPADILATADRPRGSPGPIARDKWLTASITQDAGAVIGQVFAEADRRDPAHQRRWVALVDGANHQIDQLGTHARSLGVNVAVIVDFVHVLEYVWGAAWCFFTQGHPAAEQWVTQQARAILAGRASDVAGAIRRKATATRLKPGERKGADACANYLLNKRCYLDYPTALAAGWPIATGVIEGAWCATRRAAVSPAQPGRTRREVRGSVGLPGAERRTGTTACQ